MSYLVLADDKMMSDIKVKVEDICVGFLLSVAIFIFGLLFVFGVYLRKLHSRYSHIPGPPRTK